MAEMSSFTTHDLKEDLASAKLENITLAKLFPEDDESTFRGMNVALIIENNTMVIEAIEAELKRREEHEEQ
jgi:hypothetical protein